MRNVLSVKIVKNDPNVKHVRLVKNAKLCAKNALPALSVPNTSLNALHVPSLNLIFPFVKSEKSVPNVPHVLSASQRQLFALLVLRKNPVSPRERSERRGQSAPPRHL